MYFKPAALLAACGGRVAVPTTLADAVLPSANVTVMLVRPDPDPDPEAAATTSLLVRM